MNKGQNSNHPRKNSSIKVDPIRSVEDIQKIKDLLKSKPRNLALFTLGINTNLRASDLVAITIGQVRWLLPMDELVLKEQKTGKHRRITLNKSCVDAIQNYLTTMKEPRDNLRLFNLTVPSVHRLVKGWCKKAGIRGHFGSHTLRKTWGYHQRVTFGSGLPVLMACFNHSSQAQTLAYLCIQPEEVKELYCHEL